MKHFFKLIEAPGVVLHEFGHLFFCFLAGVKIYKVKLFGFSNPLGFVEHAEPHGFFQSTLITFGPLTINSLVSLILFSQITPPFFDPLKIVFLWLGVVGGLHAIPSNGDASTLLSITNQKIKRNPLVFLGYIFSGMIYVLNFLKRFRLHFLYVGLLFWLGNIYLK